jgi:hypothetical protein
VIGRILALCGWLAWHVQRRVAVGPLRRIRSRTAVWTIAGAIAILGVIPLVAGLAQDQPQDSTVEDLFNGGVTHPDRWVRLTGRSLPLADNPTNLAEAAARYGLFVDAVNPLRSVVIEADAPIVAAATTTVTGHLVPAAIGAEKQEEVQAGLPREARVAGTPPRIVADEIVRLDASPFPTRVILWPVTLLLMLLAGVLALGAWAGYPVFRPAREVDVLARPLGPGERIPAAVGGRLGDRRIDLADPAEALLTAGRGARGSVLTIQLMPAGGPAPPPISIGGGWTTARIGYVHVLGETVAALHIRAEQADATLLFARRSERDRAAAMVATER